MATILGLDIGTKTVTGVVVAGTGKRLQIQDFFVEEIPELALMGDGPPTAEAVDLESDLPPSVGEVVRKALAHRKLQGIEVVAALGARDCVIRDRISVPFTRDDQIEKTIGFEAENHLITFDVDEMVLEYHKVGQQNGNSILLLMAFPDRVVSSRLELLREGGVDPVALDLDGAALFNAFAMTPAHDATRTTLLVDVGATVTNLVFVEHGTMKMVRSLRLGGFLGDRGGRRLAGPGGVAADAAASGLDAPDADSIDARFDEVESALETLDVEGSMPLLIGGDDDDAPIAILTDDEYARVAEAGGEALAAEEAESVAVGTAPPPPRAADHEGPQDYQTFLGRLGFEIQRMFSTSLVSPIERIVLTGGLGDRDEARRYFGETFDVETLALDFGEPGEVFEMNLDDEDRSRLGRLGATAVGLAVKGLGRDAIGLDFRKKQFRYERRFEKLKFPLLCLSIMTCVLFLLTAFDRLSKYQTYRNQLAVVRNTSSQFYSAFFDEPYRGSGLVMPAVTAKEQRWNRLLGKGSEIPLYLPEIGAIQDLAAVFNEAKMQRLGFEITNMSFQFQLKSRRTPSGARRKTSEPELYLEKDWTIQLIAEERNGEDFRRLFASKSKFWDCSPESRTRGDNTSITLRLSPREDYLKKVR